MSLSPPRACPCGGLIREGKCSRCGPKKRAPHKQTTTERGYGWDWQKLVAQRNRDPDHVLCQDCLEAGMVRAATERHHMVKIKHAPDLRLEPENIRDLCDECHDARTARGE